MVFFCLLQISTFLERCVFKVKYDYLIKFKRWNERIYQIGGSWCVICGCSRICHSRRSVIWNRRLTRTRRRTCTNTNPPTCCRAGSIWAYLRPDTSPITGPTMDRTLSSSATRTMAMSRWLSTPIIISSTTIWLHYTSLHPNFICF